MALTETSNKCIPVRVTTMDADLEFKIEKNALGRDLFDLVCRTIGLREIWYFGLQYTSTKGYFCWLQMNKKVLKQKVKDLGDKAKGQFYFLVKFFPENIEEEVIQDCTRHLFFMQTKQAILSMDVYCPPEASVLLASYAVQAKWGDYEGCNVKAGMLVLEEQLPQRVVDQYQMTEEMWEDRIKTWWSNNKGLSREDAEIEYLKIAQDLDMYGIHYFPIRNKSESDLWLGLSAYGLNIYETGNRLVPKMRFQWSEIRNISFKDKKFTVKLKGAESTYFWSRNMSVNSVILDLCVGTHNLFLRRRLPDSLEIQQMKEQAKDERLRRQTEHNQLKREKEDRENLERERESLVQENEHLRSQLEALTDAMKRTEETAELLAEKARISEEEALVLAKRASEAEAETQRIKISAIKSEEEKILIERKAREAELIANRVLEESERRNKEAERLRDDLIKARQAEKHAKERLENMLGSPYRPMDMYESHLVFNQMGTGSTGGDYTRFAPPDPLTGRSFGQDIRSLSAEIEKERVEYIEKSRHLQEQLSELRSEIDGLKKDGEDSPQDAIHAQNLQTGDNKYSTLRRTGAGSTKARIQMFDGL